MGKFELPADHQPGMRVPKGGSMCKNCKHLKDSDKRICGEPSFIAWDGRTNDGKQIGPAKPAGSNVIPGPIDAYCSDWYQPDLWKKMS